MALASVTERTTKQVFGVCTRMMEVEFALAPTNVPPSLADYGDEALVSRSQARHVLKRFDRFREVLIDFSGVASIGQGFADEIFRVFHNANPGVTIVPVGTNAQVMRMIQHVQNAGSSPPRSPGVGMDSTKPDD